MVLDSSGYVEGLWDEAEILFLASIGKVASVNKDEKAIIVTARKRLRLPIYDPRYGTHSISQSGLDHLSRPGPRVQTVSTRRRVHSIHSIGEDKIFRNC